MSAAQTVNGTAAYPAGMTQMQPALAEAQCSVNLFFEVEGYGKAQATGRGKNAQEAAANLKQTIDATRAAFAPVAATTVAVAMPVMPSRTERLAQLLAKGLACAVAKQDTELVARLSKGATLVLADAIEPGNREGLWAVRSQSNPLTFYEVDSHSCTCPNATKHRSDPTAYWCKHKIALTMHQRLEATE